MIIKQLTKNLYFTFNKKNILIPFKKSFITSFKYNKINNILAHNTFTYNVNNNLFNKKHFNSKKENKENCQKKIKKDENKPEDESKETLEEKYKELKELYHEQEAKLEQTRNKFYEIKNLYLKNLEEIDSIKIRSDREIRNMKEYAITKFAKDVLDVHDNFTRALSVVGEKEYSKLSEVEKNEIFNIFVEGIVMTQKGLLITLKKHGIEMYDPKNEKFNPNKHEAVFDYEDDELPPGTVGQVMQTGFSIGERVLRPAKVGVVKRK